jgi:hypothetical protein
VSVDGPRMRHGFGRRAWWPAPPSAQGCAGWLGVWVVRAEHVGLVGEQLLDRRNVKAARLGQLHVAEFTYVPLPVGRFEDLRRPSKAGAPMHPPS